MTITRRSVLKFGAVGALGAAGVAVPLGRSVATKSASSLKDSAMPKPYQTTFAPPPVLVPDSTGIGTDGKPVAYYTVTQKLGSAAILPGGPRTPVLGYNGVVPGPTISVDRGTRVELRMRNRLPATHPQHGHPLNTSTHLHGSASKPQYDGFANDVTYPGHVKTYKYPNFQPARTLWYHDHGVHATAQNAYSGLAAQYHLHDPLERALLPQGEFDVPVTITDAMFAADGSLAYDDNTHSGLYGDVILVNGRPWPVMKVKRRVYRFRVLNASIARAYRLQLSTKEPVTMVATDGGLMPKAQQVANWRQAPGERYEFLIDFRKYTAGQRIELRNLGNKNNVDYDHTGKVMAFDVVEDSFDTLNNAIPTILTGSTAMALTATAAKRTRYLRLKRTDDVWTINDQRWQDVVDSGYTKVVANPDLDDIEIWQIENKSGGWFHPLHIHLVDFQVLSRNGGKPFAYELGPKDVVYVGEGETVKLLMKFEHQRGRYMVHCHNLPHEDHDMMVQYSVGLKPGYADPDHPIDADPCTWDDDQTG